MAPGYATGWNLHNVPGSKRSAGGNESGVFHGLEANITSCAVLLALIGPEWLDAKDNTGSRRLDDPTDFVRLETAAALRRDIPVVPILVRGARMPRPDQLPEDLKDLAYRNGAELTHARWSSDVEILVKELKQLMAR
jgi:hypothetical protein